MTVEQLALAFAATLIAAIAAGALSGMRIGTEALGAQLAGYLGGLYGMIAGGAAAVIGLVIVAVL